MQLSASTVLMLVAGVLIAVQGPLNSVLGRAAGSPVNAALISFSIGTLALSIVAFSLRALPDLTAARALPWWAWLGGLCGAVFVTAAAYAAPRIGVATMLTIALASQLVTAVALDHVGAFGITRHPVSWGRAIGMLLVMAGVVVVRRM